MQFRILLVVAFSVFVCGQVSRSSKRGLVYVPNAQHPEDDSRWKASGSDLAWYYNYGDSPSKAFADSQMEFVPQLWGRPSTQGSTAFLDSIRSQLQAGTNITHVLGFNEPDLAAYGGSNIDPTTAADIWSREIQPLSSLGVKLGSPACSSASEGLLWMQQFLSACKNCTIDFMTVHFYGSFEGLASHIGQYVGTFNKSVWVTEYAYPGASLEDTEVFFNQSASFMDRNP